MKNSTVGGVYGGGVGMGLSCYSMSGDACSYNNYGLRLINPILVEVLWTSSSHRLKSLGS